MKKMICSRCKKRPAVIFISKIVDGKTVPEGLCINCAMEMNIGPIKQMMEQMGITEEDVDSISEQFSNMFPDNDGDDDSFEPGGSPTMPFLQGLFGDMQNGLSLRNEGKAEATSAEPKNEKETKKQDKKSRKEKDKKRKFLQLYCTDLTEKARDGKIDNIIGRDKELSRVIQILCRRSKNNPCLIGEPGVGKTAIAEGLAQKIAKRDVPYKLLDKEVYLLDLTALVAGTQFRGQF